MDLTTIKKAFYKKDYSHITDLFDHIRLMFVNCYKYNQPGSDIFKLAKKFENNFVNKILRKKGLDEEYCYKSIEELQGEWGRFERFHNFFIFEFFAFFHFVLHRKTLFLFSYFSF